MAFTRLDISYPHCAARFCAALEFIEVVNYFSYSSVDNYFYDK